MANDTNTNITESSKIRGFIVTQGRRRHHSWPKTVRPSTPMSVDGNQRRPALNGDKKEKSEDDGKEIEVYYEPAKRESNGIIICCI